MPSIQVRVVLLLVSLLLSPAATGQIALVWAEAPEANNQMFQKGVGADAEGYVYSVSGIRGSVDFGRGPIVAPSGERGLSIAKYEPGGFFIGARGTGYSADTLIFDMAVDPDGNVIVAGYFEDDDIDLGGGLIENTNGGTEGFIVKYNKFLAFQWANTFDTGTTNNFRNVAADAAGNVYLYGTAMPGLDFGGGQLDAGKFLVKFNGAGDHQWSKSLPGVSFETDIAVHPSSSVVLLGTFGVPIDFGGGEITPTGMGDFFIVQFNASDGSHEWSSGFASGTPDAIATDPDGGVYVTVHGQTSIDFGGGPLMTAGLQSVYIAKFTGVGAHVWSRAQPTDAFNVFARALGANSLGEVFVGGGADGMIDMGGGDISAPFGMFGAFMFLAKYDADGAHTWSQAIGSTESVSASSFSIDPANRVFLGGAYTGITDLGTGPFPEVVGLTRAFVAGFFDTTVPIDPANCFVATAAYGSPMAHEVDTFRAVRDEYLLRTGIGTALVDAYYRTSPPVARLIQNHPTLRTAARWALTPALYYSRALLASPALTLGGTLVAGGILALGAGRLYARRRRRKLAG